MEGLLAGLGLLGTLGGIYLGWYLNERSNRKQMGERKAREEREFIGYFIAIFLELTRLHKHVIHAHQLIMGRSPLKMNFPVNRDIIGALRGYYIYLPIQTIEKLEKAYNSMALLTNFLGEPLRSNMSDKELEGFPGVRATSDVADAIDCVYEELRIRGIKVKVDSF